MLTYPMTIAGLERALPICPLHDTLAIGAFVIFGDPELTTASADALLKIAPEYDYIIMDKPYPGVGLGLIRTCCPHHPPPSGILTSLQIPVE